MANGSSVIHTERERPRALPANVTFLDLIRRNKRKSVMLMIGMGLLTVVVGAGIAVALAAWGGGGGEALLPSLVLGCVVAAMVAVGPRSGASTGARKRSSACPVPNRS